MSEQDTREKLEADVHQYANPSGYKNTLGASWEKKMLSFLDRQAAITTAYCTSLDESCCEACRAAQKRKLAELTAECDKLQEHKRRATMKVMRLEQEREQLDRRMAELAGKYQERLQQIAELTAERDELQAAIDAMNSGQFYSMYKAKCEECEQLKKVVRTQADSFKKLEIELAGKDG